MTPIAELVVVIPARNEEAAIPGCLEALTVACEYAPVPVRIVVVLDSCSDATAEACAAYPVESLRVSYANVGRSRHAGVSHAIETSHRGFEALWIGNTDADSRVAPDWITEQVRLADDGADVVLGLANVDVDIPMSARLAYEAAYRRRISSDGSHRHVHGANFGIRASAYLAAGGFPPLVNHEDRQLLLRARATPSVVVVSSNQVVVTTSGRTVGRCQEGVARVIADLSRPPTIPGVVRLERPA